MNDVWSLLGIEPTDDKKAIRRAFAAQSRLHHPEEEPEYFAALNQAYKAAMDRGASAEKAEDQAEPPQERKESRFKGKEPIYGRKQEKIAEYQKREREKEEDRKAENRKVENEETESKETESKETESKETENEETGNEKVTYEESGPLPEDNKDGSLLKLLDEASEQAVKKSMEAGALHDFIVLFENPKQAKQADTWKRYFLSEAFLREQFSEEFGKGLSAYLAGQALCPGDNLPMGLLQELAVAYAFVPHFAGEEYFEGLKYPKEWYKVSVENTFPGRRYAAEIFNRQGRECDLKSMTGRILRQPANKVRHNAFSDYLTMREMGRDGRLTDRERDVWQQILGLCQPNYLYERNGKRPGSGAYESRSECVVKLYVQWLKCQQLPEEVLLFLYKKLDFRTLDRSSTRGLYSALKEEVLRQLPQAEEILFGEDGKEQRITQLYRTYSAIINDNQNNYDRFIYGETPEIRERARAFFALPEWEQLKNEKELFKRIYSASKRIVMPRTVAETLVEHLGAGDFPEPERTELTESLLRSLSTERMCKELDYRCQLDLGSTDPADIGDSPDFWQYYLMRGFGFRHGKVRGSWEEDYIYVMDGQCYLPAYINYLYAPSRAWQRRFVGFDEEREEIGAPVSMTCAMPGNRRLRVEFHYHYCLYFVDGVQATAPVLAFSQLQEYAEGLKKPEEFFFLLAVTAIGDSDRSAAQRLVEDWLGRIPLHPFIVPTVARLLAADNDGLPASVYLREKACEETEGTATDFAETEGRVRDSAGAEGRVTDSVGTEGAATDSAGTEGSAIGPVGTAENQMTEAVLYEEQERFCFCGLVSEKGLSIWLQMDYGWQDIIFRRAELGWRKWGEYNWQEHAWKEYARQERSLQEHACEEHSQIEDGPACEAESGTEEPGFGKDWQESTDTPAGRRAAARSILRSLRQPAPRIRAVCSLEGMDPAQKTEKILATMGCAQNWEAYCVLRYGEKKEKRHDRVLYWAQAPFGFDLKSHSMSYERSRDYLMQSSNTKIKEPKVLAGRFGWGFKYSPSSDYGPMYVYQGESGRFYAYGAVRMHREDTLEELLTDFFRKEWEGATEAVAYEGCLTVSRLDHRLEYCYTREDLQQSMGSLGDTVADRFTLFGGYGMWAEFVRWMDGMLDLGLPAWVNAIVVGLDWERGGALVFAGIHEEYACAENEEIREKGDMDLEDMKDTEDTEDTEDEEESGIRPDEGDDSAQEAYLPPTPLLVWAKGLDRRERAEFLVNAVQWYVDCGRFAEKTEGRPVRILVNG